MLSRALAAALIAAVTLSAAAAPQPRHRFGIAGNAFVYDAAIQVENEYGSFDKDHAYVAAVRDQFKAAGFTDALLYTADNPGDFDNGALPDLPVVANFGPGNAQKAFTALRQYRADGPLMSGEPRRNPQIRSVTETAADARAVAVTRSARLHSHRHRHACG